MGRGTKTCLGCVLVLVLLTCALCGLASVAGPFLSSLLVASITSNLGSSVDPAKAKQVGAQIADYSLPPGHSEQAGVDLWLLQTVVIAPDVLAGSDLRDGYIVDLLATSLPVDSSDLEKQLLSALLQQTKTRGITWQQSGVRTLTIRGQPTTLSILEDDPQHPNIRAVTGAFQGRRGQTLVQIVSQAGIWNWATVDRFLTSIR